MFSMCSARSRSPVPTLPETSGLHLPFHSAGHLTILKDSPTVLLYILCSPPSTFCKYQNPGLCGQTHWIPTLATDSYMSRSLSLLVCKNGGTDVMALEAGGRITGAEAGARVLTEPDTE